MQSLAHPAPHSTRKLRALAIAEEHFEDIAKSYKSGEYLVPSCSGRRTYTVVYTRHEESCSCPDWQIRDVVCKHVFAVAIVTAKTSVCPGCGARVRNGELVEVLEEDHLTWFAGDVICRPCADNTGVCY